MDAATWKLVQEHFERALPLGREQRTRYVREAPLGPEARAELEALLAADERSGTFLESPAFETPVEPAAAPPAPGAMVGPYRLLRRLGSGGMGVVYEAEQRNPRRLVAVKVVHGGAQVDALRLALFQREAGSLARLEHPGIATIHEAGRTDDGLPYLAMERVDGEPLDAHLRTLEGAPRPRLLRLFLAIADAVAHAHQQGVIPAT